MPLTLLEIAIGALTTWRITHILLREAGPFEVFRRLRIALGVQYVDDVDNTPMSFKFEITVCMWCASMWVGGVVALALLFLPWAEYAMLPYVFSAFAVSWDTKFGNQ